MESQPPIDSTAKLNDGREIPLGLGVYLSPPGDVTKTLCWRPWRFLHAMTLAKIKRLQRYENTLAAADTSLAKLNTGYIDLLLLHSPLPGKKKRLKSYRALEELVKSGKVKSIGISNYGVQHLRELFQRLNPRLIRLRIFLINAGEPSSGTPVQKLNGFDDANLVPIAQKHNKTSAQVLIRWGLQHGLPKSVHNERITSNADAFNFHLDDADMGILDGLDENFVTGKVGY
ncbi:4798_t:CDS:2 [Paraglomus brasilianum]|uniref:4798_t:CDS:1 n=1 Tax=Paraglomus brasilianum TaxID=144538 RepID=A0A9N9C1G9_9GLOM|nr:4798_t:CDS:2 [Paraglomus brasilianum]